MTSKSAVRILIGIVALYIIIFGVFTALRHYNFQTQTWDMAIFTQTMWNTINGHVMLNTIEEMPNHLGLHWSPILFLLIPLYWLFTSPYTLLIIQSVALGLGAVPLYFLARHILQSEKWGLVIAGSYLLYPSLHWMNTFDFHAIPLLVPLLITAFYFIETARWKWVSLFLILSALVREDAILVLVFVGIYLLVRRASASTHRKGGAVIAVASIGYLILTLAVLMPAFSDGELLRFDRYQNLGDTPAEAVITVLTKPGVVAKTIFTADKLNYLLWLLLPVAFLPLASGAALLLLVPGLLENLLTNFASQFSGSYQYDATLIAGLYVCVIYGLKNITARFPVAKIMLWVVVGAAVFGFIARSPISPFNFPFQLLQENKVWDDYRRIIDPIPPGASVAAHTNLVPHLSHRKHIYMLGTEPFLMDVVVVDTADHFGFPSKAALDEYINLYLSTGTHRGIFFADRYMLLLHNRYQTTGISSDSQQ